MLIQSVTLHTMFSSLHVENVKCIYLPMQYYSFIYLYISVLPLKFKHGKQPEYETVFRVQLQNANRKEMHGKILLKHGLIQAIQVKSEQRVNPNAKGSISVIA